MRKVVKGVVPCDANRTPPIPTEYVNQYDIVTDFLCLVSACATTEDYTAALVRLHALLKSGGKIVLYTPEYENTLTPVSYPVGPHNLFELPLTRDIVLKSLEQAGFHDVKRMATTREDLGLPDDFKPDVVGYSFITASKTNWWMNWKYFTLGPNSLIISFSSTTRMDFVDRIYHHYFYLHISTTLIKETSYRRHEHSDGRNANKRVCLVHSIQNNPSTMADNERRSSCHHACQLLSWEISVGWIMVYPSARIVCK